METYIQNQENDLAPATDRTKNISPEELDNYVVTLDNNSYDLTRLIVALHRCFHIEDMHFPATIRHEDNTYRCDIYDVLQDQCFKLFTLNDLAEVLAILRSPFKDYVTLILDVRDVSCTCDEYNRCTDCGLLEKVAHKADAFVYDGDNVLTADEYFCPKDEDETDEDEECGCDWEDDDDDAL